MNENELDDMLMNSPESVQRWAANRPRPSDPLSLVRWLVYYCHRMYRANQVLSQR